MNAPEPSDFLCLYWATPESQDAVMVWVHDGPETGSGVGSTYAVNSWGIEGALRAALRYRNHAFEANGLPPRFLIPGHRQEVTPDPSRTCGWRGMWLSYIKSTKAWIAATNVRRIIDGALVRLNRSTRDKERVSAICREVAELQSVYTRAYNTVVDTYAEQVRPLIMEAAHREAEDLIPRLTKMDGEAQWRQAAKDHLDGLSPPEYEQLTAMDHMKPVAARARARVRRERE